MKFIRATGSLIEASNELVLRRFEDEGRIITNREKFFGVERIIFASISEGMVVGTISVLVGGRLELEDLYEDEVNDLRNRTEGRLVQVGRFASLKSKKIECKLLLGLFARTVACGIELGAGKLTMKMHPTDEGFYTRINCVRFGGVKEDPEVGGNKAIAMYFDLNIKANEMRHNFGSKIIENSAMQV